MRKDLQLAAVATFSLLLLLAAAGCGGGGGGTEQPPPPPALVITTTTMPDGVVGQAYNQAVNATGGTGARTFSITVGALPAGLNIDASTGVISGTPTTTGTSNFTVQVVDSGSPQQTDTQALTIDINNNLTITPATLAVARVGVPYSQTVVATGGTPPYTFTISSGSLPAGLTINAAGAISGTPTASATSQNFTVRVADSSNPQDVDVEDFIIFVFVEITTTSLPSGTVGVPYNQTVVARGGSPVSYTWSITAGNLPAGLQINSSTGAITGTPTTQETQAFTVQVVDGDLFFDTQDLSITINAAPVLGRNDSVATATVLGTGAAANGTYSASISPSGDPNTTLAPDEDFYAITTTAASTVTIDINAEANGSPLDSVIEIVDVNGVRLNLCVSPTFNSACVNDDQTPGSNLDSFLQIQVSGATTFYVHVVDFRGDGRPDLLYDIVISGVN